MLARADSSKTPRRVVERPRSFHHLAGGRASGPARPAKVVAKLLVAAALIGTWLTFLAPSSLGGPVSMIWVSGTSMEPTLFNGDLAVLYRANSYEVGDIVAFEIPEGGTVIHRVIRTTPTGYEFQGDNRDWQDPWDLDESWIQGRQIFHVPKAAQAMSWLAQPVVMAVLVGALVLVGQLRAMGASTESSASTA